MMDEVNPMAEMGLIHDKQVILEAQGFLAPCDTLRGLAETFIENGGKLYDLFDRYDKITTYVLNRENVGNITDAGKLLAPFLKAYEANDYSVEKYYHQNMKLLPGAKEAMRYFLDTLPTFVDSRMYEHAALALSEIAGIPMSIFNCSNLNLDENEMSRQTCRELRQMAAGLAKIRMSKMVYELNVPVQLDDAEVAMITALDETFQRKLPKTEAAGLLENTSMVGANEKAYALLDIRKSTQVDLDGTAYIGGEQADFQALDLVKDGNGLSMSFNGSEFAVHGCNVAVLSEDCTVAAVLVSKFYDTGIQGVFDLVDNWNRDYITEHVPDRNLARELLRRHPRKLPEVYRVDKDNVYEVAEKSDRYRKRIFAKYAKL